MSQTRFGSIIESVVNIIVGFTINFFANMFVFPLFGIHISVGQNLTIGCIYTVISIVRSYCLRRAFNKIRSLHHA